MTELCRLCLRVSTDNHQLFVTCIGEKLIIELIWTTFGVQIDECDNLPTNICERCLKKVEHLNSFHEEVITSQTQLNHWKESGTLDASLTRLLSTEASRQPSDDILEQVVEATSDSITRGIVQQPCTSVLVNEDENTLEEKTAIDENIQSGSRVQDDEVVANDKQQSLSAEEHINDIDYQDSYATRETRSCLEAACEKRFRTSDTLKVHIGLRHKCKICGKHFPKWKTLRAHMLTHESYKCHLCDKLFNSSSAMRWHMHKFHKQKLEKLLKAGSVKNDAKQQVAAESDIEKSVASNDIVGQNILCHETSRDIEEEKNYIKKEALDIAEELISEKLPEDSKDSLLASVCNKTVENNETNLSSTDLQNEIETRLIALEYNFPVHLRASKTYPRPCEESGCTYVGKTVKLMRLHYRNHYKVFQCRECLRKFAHKGVLKNHIEVEHLNTRKFECKICNKTFKKKKTFDIHTHKETRGKDLLQCSICQATFAGAILLYRHMEQEHSTGKTTSDTITHEQQAINLKESDEAPAGIQETCSSEDNNEKSQYNNANLSTDIVDNIGDEDGVSTSKMLSRLSADVNGVVWSNSKNGIDKIFHAKPVRVIYKLIFPKSLKNEKSYPRGCLETGCDFISKTCRTMLGHYQCHYKMYKCQQCERKFANAPKLKNHIQFQHIKTKNNTCNICGKYFSDKSQLTEHVLIHQIVKPHKCQLCFKSFNFRSGLRWHMIKHHKQAQQNVKIEADSEADSITIAAESDTETPKANNAISDENILCNDTSKNIKLEALDTDENLITEEPQPGDTTGTPSSSVSEIAVEKNKFNYII